MEQCYRHARTGRVLRNVTEGEVRLPINYKNHTLREYEAPGIQKLINISC